MCASASLISLLNIHAHSSDEEIIIFLDERKPGDPIPSSVITEVDPFNIEPWNSPENMLYLYNPVDSQSHQADTSKKSDEDSSEINVTRAGYWKMILQNELRMLEGSSPICRKTTRQFYVGQSPFGDKTAWRMQDYRSEQKAWKEYSSLCRVFWHDDKRLDSKENQNPVNADGIDDADAEFLQAVLMSPSEEEEYGTSRQYGASGIELIHGDEHHQEETSSKICQGTLNDIILDRMQLNYVFSEDYLELDDLRSPGSSWSSSDNYGLMSISSEECFDAESLLRDLESNASSGQVVEHQDVRLNVSFSLQSDQLVLRPPPSGLIHSDHVSACPSASSTASTTAFTLGAPTPAPTTAPGSQSRGIRRVGSSSGASSVGGMCSKSVGRIMKLGKRYCCFASFSPHSDS